MIECVIRPLRAAVCLSAALACAAPRAETVPVDVALSMAEANFAVSATLDGAARLEGTDILVRFSPPKLKANQDITLCGFALGMSEKLDKSWHIVGGTPMIPMRVDLKKNDDIQLGEALAFRLPLEQVRPYLKTGWPTLIMVSVSKENRCDGAMYVHGQPGDLAAFAARPSR